MNCNFVEEHMLDLAAGNAASSEVTKHLNACTGCATKLDEFRSTMALLDEWQAPEPSPYFDTRLKARLREEQTKAPARAWLQWVRRPAFALVATVLLVASATVYIGRVRDDKSAVVSAPPGTAVGDLQRLDKDTDLRSEERRVGNE